MYRADTDLKRLSPLTKSAERSADDGAGSEVVAPRNPKDNLSHLKGPRLHQARHLALPTAGFQTAQLQEEQRCRHVQTPMAADLGRPVSRL